MSYPDSDVLTIAENGQPIEFTFGEMLKYHGFGFPGGVAHAFKVMQRGFPLLDNGNAPERAELSIETAFPGPGGRDAFEVVTRVVTGDRYHVDVALAGDDVLESPKGKYLFRLKYRGCTVDLTLRPGLVVDEFVTLARKDGRTPAEEERLVQLKKEMATRLLSRPADEVYDVKVVD